jgi:hypothetical protein
MDVWHRHANQLRVALHPFNSHSYYLVDSFALVASKSAFAHGFLFSNNNSIETMRLPMMIQFLGISLFAKHA